MQHVKLKTIKLRGQPQARLDLLLTDVIMPGMDGRELARRIGETQPAMKVLFISGYPAENLSHCGRLAKDTAFLSKPFSQNDLVRRVHAVLNNGSMNAKRTPNRSVSL